MMHQRMNPYRAAALRVFTQHMAIVMGAVNLDVSMSKQDAWFEAQAAGRQFMSLSRGKGGKLPHGVFARKSVGVRV